MSLLTWAMTGIAFWHFAVLVPDRFVGGIVGAFLAALLGSLGSGYLLPEAGLPSENPAGMRQVLWATPGALLALAGSYWWGARREERAR